MAPRLPPLRLRARLAVRVVALTMHWRRRIDNRIVLIGDPLQGNLAAFASYLRAEHPSIEVMQLSFPPRGRPGRKGIDGSRLGPLFKASRARAIVSSAGPRSLAPWVSLSRRPLFVDVWHGVGFKARVMNAGRPFLCYDAHFVSSPYVAEYYRAAGAKPLVTGYARMDSITTAPLVPGSFLLVAPTWAASTHLEVRTVLETINAHAIEFDYEVTYRPHPYSPPVEIADLERVSLRASASGLDTIETLRATRALVTDWSSIASDYLPLGRPIIYLEGDMPAAPGPLDSTDRPGPMVTTLHQLRSALDAAISSPEATVAPYESRRRATLERAWGATLDERAAQRYYDAILHLEAARDRRG